MHRFKVTTKYSRPNISNKLMVVGSILANDAHYLMVSLPIARAPKLEVLKLFKALLMFTLNAFELNMP